MKRIDPNMIAKAVDAMHQGEVIAYPTEAVYGLGCDPFNAEAVTKILQLKHRSINKGFILVAENWEQLESFVEPIEPRTLYQVLETWPGPVTWIFPARPDIPEWIRGKNKGIAVRVSNHPIVKALCHAFGKPIISTSANTFGHPPIRDYRTVKMIFGDQLGMIIEGEVGNQIRPTIIKNAVTGETIRE